MTNLPNEIQVQKKILEFLQDHDISPFNIVFTYSENTGGLLSITFYIPSDIDELLELLDYKTICDKSGYEVFPKTNTLILRDLALVNLYTILK